MHSTPVLLSGKCHGRRSLVGCSPWGLEESDTTERLHSHFSLFTFHFHALEKEMATHSGVLAWRIPGTGEPGGLPSLGSHRVRHNWSDLAAAKTLQGDIFSFIKGTSLKSPLHINTFITNICHFKNGRVELMSPDQEPFRPDTRKDVTPWKQNCSSSQQLLP